MYSDDAVQKLVFPLSIYVLLAVLRHIGGSRENHHIHLCEIFRSVISITTSPDTGGKVKGEGLIPWGNMLDKFLYALSEVDS